MRDTEYTRTEIAVRTAQTGDAQAIATIYNHGIVERIATFETELRTREFIERQLIESGTRYPTVVVIRGLEVVAWAAATPYSSRSCYGGIGEFSVYTHREHRGLGAGTLALTALMQSSREAGLWKLVSRVFPENSASRRLCQTLGFREVGVYRQHARLDGVWRDVVIVERLLDE